MVTNLDKKVIIEKSFNIMLYVIMLIVIVLTLFPFWYCLVGSFNEGSDYLKGGVILWPRKFTLANYEVVFMDKDIINSYKITVLRTIIGTVSHLIFTSVFAYAYSRKILKFKNIYMLIGMIPMYFGGGLIPTYLLYQKLGLLDNFLVYIIPGIFSFWHVIIMQAFFRGIPDSLAESAMLDGANEYRIYWSVIMPLSAPVLAAIALFSGVGHWNAYFDSMVFTTSKGLQTIQVYLMKIIRSEEMAARMAAESSNYINDSILVDTKTIQLATMMSVTLPIVAIYPFLQKYFVKGMLIGSIKG